MQLAAFNWRVLFIFIFLPCESCWEGKRRIILKWLIGSYVVDNMNWIQPAEGCIMAGFNIIMSLNDLFVLCVVIWLCNHLAIWVWRCLFVWFIDKSGQLLVVCIGSIKTCVSNSVTLWKVIQISVLYAVSTATHTSQRTHNVFIKTGRLMQLGEYVYCEHCTKSINAMYDKYSFFNATACGTYTYHWVWSVNLLLGKDINNA